MKLLLLSLLFLLNIARAEEIEGEKYKWFVVVEKVIDNKTVKENIEANKTYLKIDTEIVCEVNKEYIRPKFEIYPNLRAKRITCNYLGQVFFLETACLKSEKLQVIVKFKEDKIFKKDYYVRCEL